LHEVNFLSDGMPAEQIARHPFGKVPALQHGDYQLYETAAISRYIDGAFSGPSLQPADHRQLGRMVQIVCIIDAYLSEPARMGFASELLVKPLMGFTADEKVGAQAADDIQNAFAAVCECMQAGCFLVGDSMSLADLHAVPMIDYIDKTPGGDVLIAQHPAVHEWWSNIKTRPSVVDTQPDLSVFSRSALAD
jgi:glutathione S-transferase